MWGSIRWAGRRCCCSSGNANGKSGPNGESGANSKSGKGNGDVGKSITEISGGEISFPNTKQQATRLQSIEEKLKNGEKLSESEVQDIRGKISGLRASAEFLNQKASDLEVLLKRSS